MSTSRSRTESPGEEPAPNTLRAVLYANPVGEPPRERDWADLIRSIAEGDQEALHALYDRAHRPVFTLMLRITGTPPTAEELTVDVFHDVWRRASSYDPERGTVLAWILNQARSRAIDRLRFDGRLKRNPRPGVEEWRESTAPRDAAEHVALRRNVDRLRTALGDLTSGERDAIETAFLRELSYTETAAELEQPLGTIKTRIRSGLAKLRAAMLDEVETP